MRIQLDGKNLDAGMPAAAEAAESAAAKDDLALRAEREKNTRAYLENVVKSAIQGTLPRDRELRAYEPERLSPTMLNAIIDQASGMDIAEVCAKYEINQVYFRMLINHPDAQTLRAAILGSTADRLADPRARIEGMVGEALNVKVELMRTAKSEQVRDKSASDLLALAGYGGRGTQINVNSNNRTSLHLPKEAGLALAEAMKLAASEDHSDYSRFVAAGNKGDEIITEHKQLSEGLLANPGQVVSEDGASPVPSPDSTSESSPELEDALREEKEWSAESRKRRIA